MSDLFKYISFELKRFFVNIKLVVIFLISPLLATVVFALVAYQSPRDIPVGIFVKNSNEQSLTLSEDIKSVEILNVRDISSSDEGRNKLRSGDIKAFVEIEVNDGTGNISVIDDPRYPEVQGKVREKISDAIKESLKQNVANRTENEADKKYQDKIDLKFALFADSILGSRNSSLSKAIDAELESSRLKVKNEIGRLIDTEIEEQTSKLKENIKLQTIGTIDAEFADFEKSILSIIPEGPLADNFKSQINTNRENITKKIDEVISVEAGSSINELKNSAKKSLEDAIDSKFAEFKKDLSPSNPLSPLNKTIRGEIDQFKSELKGEEINIEINTEPIKFETSENLPKEIKYFDRYSSGAIPLVIVLIFLLKAATSLSQDRESGVLERLFSTPASRSKIIFSKIISNILIGIISTITIVIVLKFAFGVAMGNLLLVFVISLLTAIVSVTLGILISAFTRDLASSIQFAFYTFFIMVLSSEFFFAKENIQPMFRYITNINPLTYAVSALRKVNLFNWGFNDIKIELLVLFLFAAVYSVVAVFLVQRESR